MNKFWRLLSIISLKFRSWLGELYTLIIHEFPMIVVSKFTAINSYACPLLFFPNIIGWTSLTLSFFQARNVFAISWLYLDKQCQCFFSPKTIKIHEFCFLKPRQFHSKFLRSSIVKILLAPRVNHVSCVNSLQQVCFPDIIRNLLSIYSFVKNSSNTVANDADYIAIGYCNETGSYFTRTVIFVVVNEWFEYLSLKWQLSISFLISVFFCFGHGVLICGTVSVHCSVWATTVCTFCPLYWLIATFYGVFACTT